MTNEEKLDNFRNMIMKSVRQSSADELDMYQESLDDAFEEYKTMKEQQAEAVIKAERVNLHREMNKTVSLEQIKIRHEYTKQYEERKKDLFAEVKELLAQYMGTPAYEQLLVRQIKKAVKIARGEQVIIYIDPADAVHHASLQKATGAELTVSEYSFEGGIRAVLPQRNVLIDESFQTKIKEAMENFSFEGGNSSGK